MSLQLLSSLLLVLHKQVSLESPTFSELQDWDEHYFRNRLYKWQIYGVAMYKYVSAPVLLKRGKNG